MKIYALSDWHLSINNPKPMDIFGGAWTNYVDEMTQNLNDILTDEDILLIAGDISWAMQIENAQPDLDFIASFKGKKVILRGNHDYWWKAISVVRKMAGENTFVIQNDSIKIGNVVIAGSRGWVEGGDEENQKIYAREVLRIKMSLDDAQKKRQEGDKLIIMTHYPPFDARKVTKEQIENGTFTHPVVDAITKANADAVVYGHIHGQHYKGEIKTVVNNIPYYLSSCDILQNKPVLVLEV